jgi:hypothetical protein
MGSLVTKKFIIGEGFSPRGYSPGLWTCASKRQDASETVQDNSRAEVLILVMDRSKCERRITQKASRGQSLFACSVVRLFLWLARTFRWNYEVNVSHADLGGSPQ